MDSLLFEINKKAKSTLTEKEIIDSNINLVENYLSMSTEQLNEAVTTWLAKVRNTIATGKLDPKKKEAVTRILGALAAISNPDLADALDTEGDLGTILFNAGGEDNLKSNAGLQRLLMLGKHPSVKTFMQNAMKAVEDPQAIEAFTKQIQAKIDPIMNKRLAKERRSQTV